MIAKLFGAFKLFAIIEGCLMVLALVGLVHLAELGAEACGYRMTLRAPVHLVALHPDAEIKMEVRR